MKQIVILTLLSIFALAPNGINEECKVLKPELEGEYTGECRRGLAHGFGKATGKDTYEGNFRNGLPHGEGRYVWSTGETYEGWWRSGLRHGRGTYTHFEGGEEVTKTGVWARDEFSSASASQAEYKVLRQRSINDVRVHSSGEGSNVVFKVTRFGSPLVYRNLYYSGSSGQQRLQGQEIRFEHVSYPFTASLRYTVSNMMNTGSFDCELEITIVTPGSWEVITVQ